MKAVAGTLELRRAEEGRAASAAIVGPQVEPGAPGACRPMAADSDARLALLSLTLVRFPAACKNVPPS